MTDDSQLDDINDLDFDSWASIGNSHESINKAVADSLREAILSGRFQPGERLVETKLAKAFNVSRNPVREALRALEAEGILEINPRKGAKVSLLTSEEIDEIIELRAELESMSAKLAARRCGDEVREEFRNLLEAGNYADMHGDEKVLSKLNQKFHTEIAMAGKNRFLVGFMKALHEKTQWIFATRPEFNIAENWKEHAAILQAVIDADEELASVLAKRHVEEIGKEIALFSKGNN